MQKIWINDQLVPETQAKISIFDRGFLYGDGVYETVRVYEGKIFRAEGHWKRLRKSLKGIHLQIPWSNSNLTEACLRTVQANGLKECLVRITITRGKGEVGYDPKTCNNPSLVIFATPIRKNLLHLWLNGVKISVVPVRRNHPKSLNPSLKTINCLNGILAKIESLKENAFEGLFLNLEENLAEGTISNIFIIKNGVLKTPSLECGILDGVTRGAVIEASKKQKIKIKETKINVAELLKADEVFLTSTTMEIMPVIQVDKKPIKSGNPGPLSKILHKALRTLIQKELSLSKEFLNFRVN
ncbi:MAG: aminotransferase class IV [Elusimicrobia bacterium]|nr:aminotransferase class IV [Elusimicrobiota bacterium]